MPKESFLFVPYHGGQKNSAGSKLTNSDARSHAAAVSRSRRDNTRLQSQVALQQSINLRLAPVDHGKPDESSSNDEYEWPPTPSPTSGSDLSPTSKPSGMVKGRRRQHMRAMQFSWRAGNASADFKISASIPSSPTSFSDFGKFGLSVVDYYKQVIAPVNQPIYAIFNVTNVYTSYWMRLLQDEDYRPAGFAMVGAVMQRVGRPGTQPSDEVRHNQKAAISRVQKRFQNALKSGRTIGDDMLIITVLALASLARFLGDLTSYTQHKDKMRSMVASRGGLDALGHEGLVKCTLLQWDSFWVFETRGTPLFSDARPEHIPVYPVFPLSADLREIFIKVPVGFQSLIMKGKISVELIEVLGRMADAAEGGVNSIAPQSDCHSKHRKYNDFLEACPFLATSDASKVTLEKDVCLALLLYCSNTFTTARSSAALYASARMELTRLLEQNDYSALPQPELECLFWVCVVCVDSWRQNGPTSPLLPMGEGLLPVLRNLATSVSAEHTMLKFFYNQELVDGCSRYLKLAG